MLWCMPTVSFTVTEQDILDHMIVVHGHPRRYYEAHTESFIVAEHVNAHELNRNQAIEHTHNKGTLKRIFEGGDTRS